MSSRTPMNSSIRVVFFSLVQPVDSQPTLRVESSIWRDWSGPSARSWSMIDWRNSALPAMKSRARWRHVPLAGHWPGRRSRSSGRRSTGTMKASYSKARRSADDLVEQRAVVVAEAAPENEVLRPLDRPRRVDLDAVEVADDLEDAVLGRRQLPVQHRGANSNAPRRGDVASDSMRHDECHIMTACGNRNRHHRRLCAERVLSAVTRWARVGRDSQCASARYAPARSEARRCVAGQSPS